MFDSSSARIEAFAGNVNAMDHGDDSRVTLAWEYFEMAMERPWLGWGNGADAGGDGEGAHNIYLSKWVHQGIISLLAVLFLFASLFRLGRRFGSLECQVFAMFLTVQGFFSHNLFDDKPIAITCGLLIGRAVLQRTGDDAPSLPRSVSQRPVRRPHFNGPRAVARSSPSRPLTINRP